MLLYANDMLIVAKSMSDVNKLKMLLSREFDMEDLATTYKILRMEIHRDRALGRLWLSQSCYVGKGLERFNMENAKLVSSPFSSFHSHTLHNESNIFDRYNNNIIRSYFSSC